MKRISKTSFPMHRSKTLKYRDCFPPDRLLFWDWTTLPIFNSIYISCIITQDLKSVRLYWHSDIRTFHISNQETFQIRISSSSLYLPSSLDHYKPGLSRGFRWSSIMSGVPPTSPRISCWNKNFRILSNFSYGIKSHNLVYANKSL